MPNRIGNSLTHRLRTLQLLACVSALGVWGRPALSAPSKVVALPTTVTADVTCSQNLAELTSPRATEWRALGRHLDGLIADAVEDAGFELSLRSKELEQASSQKRCPPEPELLALAQKSWVIAPQILVEEGKTRLRLVVGTPGSSVLKVSTREFVDTEIDVRAVVMVSELLRGGEGARGPGGPATPTAHDSPASTGVARPGPSRGHSPGRAVLTLTSGFLGGAVGYSLQRASGSNDPRLTYPLIALGTGMGLGTAIIAADEWDISVAEAWYLNAGMLWPATSGLLLARAYQVQPTTDRYVYGLVGAAGGIALSSFALNTTEMTEGGALVTHSGGIAGLLFGGLVDMSISGTTSHLPWHGMGFGSAIGVLGAGTLATRTKISSSRVLFIDMAAGLGALTGAAAGSPLLFVENDLSSVSAPRKRAWLSVVGLGALAGGGIGWYLTRHWTAEEHEGSGGRRITYFPYASMGPMPHPTGIGYTNGFSAGLQGQF